LIVVAQTILEEHWRRNQTTRDRWQTMASHRTRVMELIAEARGETGRSLCVLGAGNANDIDLAALARDFERIALVDLDAQAVTRAVERMPEADLPRIQLHGGLDLTGILATLESWRTGHVPADAEMSAAINSAGSPRPPAVEPFDVVVSTCLLTQLIDSIYLCLGASHHRREELVLAVRNGHLELMVDLLKPGGRGVLVTDFVSSETAPELATIDDEQVPRAAVRWINAGNFFTGANPYAIRDYFLKLRYAGRVIEDVQVCPAWRWDIGAKQLAVAAVTFRRRA
jgi:hypothetical protein